MTSSIALQQKALFQSLTEIPSSTSPIKKLNKDLLRSICNYIKPQEVAKIVHLVCKAWPTLLPNDGILDLRNSKIKGQDLSRLIENYIVGAKLHSLDLSRCDHVGDVEMVYLGGFPSTRLNFQLQEKYQKNLRLEKLIFSDCSKITVAGIKQLSTLSITHLDLSVNLWMSDKAVGYLTALPLKHLSLGWCPDITDEGFKTLARLSNLQSLNFDNCNVTNAALKELSELNLVDLDLAICNKITGAGLKPLLKASLQTLGLRGCGGITDSILQDLSSCHQLTQLKLSFCHEFTDIGLKAITKCPLKRLELSRCHQLSGKSIGHLANSVSLTYLDLGMCWGVEKSMKMLSSLPLTTLILNDTLISDQGMEDLARCSSLTSLNLDNCSKITDEGIKAISHLNLRKLNLDKCKISDLSLQHLAGCSSLTSLSLDRCTKISDRGMQDLARCSSLTSLNLDNCSKITDEGIKAISHLNLRKLNLDKCKISDLSLQHLAGCSSLTSLSLYRCTKITDEGIKAIRHHKLTSIILNQCAISDRCFEDLARLPLQELSVFECSQITKKACENLKARFSDRRINFRGIS